jgi:hypothetical protein
VLVEWTAIIRGERVKVRWRGGELDGDRAVLDRIAHLPGEQIRLDTVDGARRAVARVLLEPVEVVRLPTAGPVPPSPDVPTPNEPLPPPPSMS